MCSFVDDNLSRQSVCWGRDERCLHDAREISCAGRHRAQMVVVAPHSITHRGHLPLQPLLPLPYHPPTTTIAAVTPGRWEPQQTMRTSQREGESQPAQGEPKLSGSHTVSGWELPVFGVTLAGLTAPVNLLSGSREGEYRIQCLLARGVLTGLLGKFRENY